MAPNGAAIWRTWPVTLGLVGIGVGVGCSSCMFSQNANCVVEMQNQRTITAVHCIYTSKTPHANEKVKRNVAHSQTKIKTTCNQLNEKQHLSQESLLRKFSLFPLRNRFTVVNEVVDGCIWTWDLVGLNGSSETICVLLDDGCIFRGVTGV
jgi:hypothetical protein